MPVRAEANTGEVWLRRSTSCRRQGAGVVIRLTLFILAGGDSGDRTRNLRLAKPALSQLSYIPWDRSAFADASR